MIRWSTLVLSILAAGPLLAQGKPAPAASPAAPSSAGSPAASPSTKAPAGTAADQSPAASSPGVAASGETAPSPDHAAGARPPAPPGSVIIAVNLPLAAPYLVLAETEGPSGHALAPPVSVNGPKAAVELPAAAKKEGSLVLSVIQSKDQLMARKPVDVRSGSADLSLTPADFDRVAALPVLVTSGGKAVSSALVALIGPDGKSLGEQPLLPGQGGVVTFRGVPAGKNTVRVTYNDHQTATQEIDVDPAAPPNRRQAEISVVGASLTEPLSRPVGAPPEGAKGKAPAGRPSSTPQETASPLAGLVGYFIALAVMAVLILGGIALFRERPEVLKRLLGRLPLPEEEPEPLRAAEPPPVQVPPGTCPFCGTAKDPVTGACACTLPAGAGDRASAGASAGAPAAGPRLVGLSGAMSGHSFPLRPDGITLGRDAANDIALVSDTTASRQHARVERSNGTYLVQDVGSSNGTFLNGTRITEATLRPGDELTIGQSRFRYEE